MINGHEAVGLGLPSGTMWATCNVGAEPLRKREPLLHTARRKESLHTTGKITRLWISLKGWTRPI